MIRSNHTSALRSRAFLPSMGRGVARSVGLPRFLQTVGLEDVTLLGQMGEASEQAKLTTPPTPSLMLPATKACTQQQDIGTAASLTPYDQKQRCQMENEAWAQPTKLITCTVVKHGHGAQSAALFVARFFLKKTYIYIMKT